jgi:hypothetical protein
MNKKSRRPKRLLLDSETTKLLNAAAIAGIRGGFGVPPSVNPPCESAAQGC